MYICTYCIAKYPADKTILKYIPKKTRYCPKCGREIKRDNSLWVKKFIQGLEKNAQTSENAV